MHEIPHIKHIQNALYPGIKPFAYVLFVGFHAQRNLCDKQNVLFYSTSPRIWSGLGETAFLSWRGPGDHAFKKVVRTNDHALFH